MQRIVIEVRMHGNGDVNLNFRKIRRKPPVPVRAIAPRVDQNGQPRPFRSVWRPAAESTTHPDSAPDRTAAKETARACPGAFPAACSLAGLRMECRSAVRQALRQDRVFTMRSKNSRKTDGMKRFSKTIKRKSPWFVMAESIARPSRLPVFFTAGVLPFSP